MKVILSIKPEFVEKIFSGEKQYEYRRKVFKQEVDSVIIYATKPIGKFVGEFKIEDIIHDKPEKIWRLTKKSSGISYNYFKEYFIDRTEGFALKITDLDIYKNPIDPFKAIPNFTAPQSFRYIENF